jgi:gamma-glutamyltranspeptidase/glutathione hydrolase
MPQPSSELRRLGALVKAPLCGLVLLWPLLLTAAAETPPAAAVATAHPEATEAGFEVLEAGGNAFDAAVAVSAALAVVEPAGSGLGGGGFWLLHRASDGRQVMLDGRERAPLAAHRDMYLDEEGRFLPELALNGPLAAGIPGEPAALAHLASAYGRLPLERSLEGAIRLARDGFAVDEHMHRLLTWRREALAASPAAAAQFLVDGEVPPVGHVIRQPDLAATLERLASRGHAGFYGGETARRLVEGVRAAGGIWTHKDLREYRAVERDPIVGHYRGWRVVSAAPPSSGGVLLVQMLNMLEQLEIHARSGASRAHLLAEVKRRAYRDRARYLGDPDFVDMPLERLTHPFYAAGLVRDIRADRATPSLGATASGGGTSTTHYSVLDREGNRVAATLSINYPFGSGFMAPGTGVLLNDEMDDFSAQPGAPNAYGLVGGEANAIAPGKRMLSSMTPTFAESERGVALLGTPGGSRIITTVLQALLALDAGEDPARLVANPRLHHQFLPDEIQYEPDALSAAERDALTALGHRLRVIEDGFGNMQVVFWDRANRVVRAASDPRGLGRAEVR